MYSDQITVFDALIDGLRISNQKLNDKCLAALRSIGKRVVPNLQAAAADQATQDPHRRRLLVAIEMIENGLHFDGRVGFHVIEALFESLRVHNSELNCKAIQAIKCLPAGLINRLITEAVCNYKKPGFCVRLLSAAEQLDGSPDVNQHMNLFTLMSIANPKVREQVGRLLLRYAPH